MKTTKLLSLSFLNVMLYVGASHAQGLTLNFSANSGTEIEFFGSQNMFNFNAGANPYQWTVTDENGGVSAVGLQGSVLNGPFSYGPISTSGSGLSEVQYANVLGPMGNLKIDDGSSGFLTGSVNWIDIATYASSLGGLNATLNVNVTAISYTGSNPDLQYLVAHQPGSLDVSFQFATAEDLSSLSTGTGPYATTSYSGSLSVVPEPSTLAVAGLSGLGLLLLRRRK